MIKFIENIGDFFSSNYFNEDFRKNVFSKSGYSQDHLAQLNKRLNALKDKYFRYKKLYLEENLRTKDKIKITHEFHQEVLLALEYPGDHPEYNKLFHLSENEVLPVRHTLYRGDKPHLMIMEMQALIKESDHEPDGIFQQRYNIDEEEKNGQAQRYHRSQWDKVFQVPEGLKISPTVINKAISELFLLEQHNRPRFILLLAGNILFLFEAEKWFRGSYLKFDLEELFTETAIQRDYYSLFYLLTGKDAIAPEADIVLMEQLDEDSHKSAYAVTKDLKEGIINAVESLANEATWYMKKEGLDLHGLDAEFAGQLKDDCLTIVYRLLFIFYAESRDDLDILPANDAHYEHGYSLEMLRDLEQVPMNSESTRNGYFFHESLTLLFGLLAQGYREKNGINKSFVIRHLDSPLFDNNRLHYLQEVKFRNIVWQEIICNLSLSKKQKGKPRGRISYANLGINQLGSVYEGLLAYRGYFAEEDLIEVHPEGKPEEGTYLTPRSRRDLFKQGEVLINNNDEEVVIPKGTFVYRLSGRDRQRTASYYTPEVLTKTTVKYTLKPILEKLDTGEMKALDLLNLKILEPAMGAAAFHNEMINQLAEAYLKRRQQEVKSKVEPDQFQEELQKVKAYIALNNVYGVDINPTAIELGRLSLWLNVIHKDMQTPFFGYRLGQGNAIVGAWLKVYKHKDFSFERVKNSPTKWINKTWWEKAPKMLEFGARGIKRKEGEVYHFLLPDKNMVPSAGIKMLKEEYPEHVKRVAEWRKDFCEPIKTDEYYKLLKISQRVDDLLEEHYQFQRQVNAYTHDQLNFFGGYGKDGQTKLELRTYGEKEKIAQQREKENAPYLKLKMIMDYWCALWFWDVRDADQLPTRAQYWQDIADILELDLEAKDEEEVQEANWARPKYEQLTMFDSGRQLSLQNYRKKEITEYNLDKIIRLANRKDDLYHYNSRLQLVKQYAKRYLFFHYQLEFIEVFRERGGFDVIVGNPPWVKMEFEEKGVVAEKYPEVVIRRESATLVRNKVKDLFNDNYLAAILIDENIEAEAAATFLNSEQNYPLLKGQQTNFYKCIIENVLNILSRSGFSGLIHPEGIYDDPNAGLLRNYIYRRLLYHFQFINTLNLFHEILHWVSYSINVYSGSNRNLSFISMHNLYHPSTINSSLVHDGKGIPEGLKIKENNSSKNYIWNIKPHLDRVVKITSKELEVFSTIFENNNDWSSSSLITIHTNKIMQVLEKLSSFSNKVLDNKFKTTLFWDETNAQNDGTIVRETTYINNDYNLIYSGPHFYVSQPIFKNPRKNCKKPLDYDIIDLINIDQKYTPRTNYIPGIDKNVYISKVKGLSKLYNSSTKVYTYDNFIDYYKLAFSKMLSLSGERTLQPSILPPSVSHTNAVISIIFEEYFKLLEFTGISSSIVIDFFIKIIGRSNLYDKSLRNLPMNINEKYKNHLYIRVLLLNCLNIYYKELWEFTWNDNFLLNDWSKNDYRLKNFKKLKYFWEWTSPLRNYYERRQALVEIDVIVAMALGLSLDELILIYNVQFPVLQQNEDDTWYDQKGNIVFTCSKGLTGVGMDRKEWEHIKDLQENQVIDCKKFPNMRCDSPGQITYTITKSELYHGKEVIYYAPFDKCDRVEDYKLAWAHFEKVFNQEAPVKE